MIPSLCSSGAWLLDAMDVAADDGSWDTDRILLSAFRSGRILELQRTDILDLDNPRLTNRERLWSLLTRTPDAPLTGPQRRMLRKHFLTSFHCTVNGFRKAFEELLLCSKGTIMIFIRIWRSIDTCLQLGLDDFSIDVKQFWCKWWVRVANSVSRNGSYHHAAKDWKKFQKFLYLKHGGSIQPAPVWDHGWPPLPPGTWLVSGDKLSELNVGKWSWLISGRGLPHGDHITIDEAIGKHTRATCQQEPSTEEELVDLTAVSIEAAEEVAGYVPPDFWSHTTGHISISASACLESSRTEGGRRAYVLKTLDEWLSEVPDRDVTVELPTGEAYHEVAGKTRRETVKPPGMDSRSIPKDAPKISTGLLTEDFPQNEQERVAFQLFSWSFSVLRHEGYLDRFGYPTGKPMPVERKAIGEPGLKTRVVTKSMAAFVTYGQPAAHFVNGALWHDPSLRAGLRAGSQGFEWLKQFEPGQMTPKYLMVGDFETSTDFVKHENANIMMDSLFDGLKIQSRYVRGYFQLLLSSRSFKDLEDQGLNTVTTAGSLMGEPGTKAVLTFAAKVANVYARPSRTTWFATAGDDQIDADDDPRELLAYAEASRITSMIPSTDKWAVMSRAVVYCQDVLLANHPSDSAKIDIPKLRLASPEQKQRMGDEDTNPAFGKSREIRNVSRWMNSETDNTILAIFLSRFLRNMVQYIEFRPELYVHPEWGGLGLPLVDTELYWDKLPKWKRSLILEREDGNHTADAVLRQWGQVNILERGQDIGGELEAEMAYIDLFSYVPTVSTDQLREQFPEGTSFSTLRALSKREGYLSTSEAARLVVKSQSYQSFWKSETRVTRGFRTESYPIRDARLQRNFERNFVLRSELKAPVGRPRWKPDVFLDASSLYLLEVCGDETVLPLLGRTEVGPRVFTHLSNGRLGRCANLVRTGTGPDQFAHIRQSSPIRKRKRFHQTEAVRPP